MYVHAAYRDQPGGRVCTVLSGSPLNNSIYLFKAYPSTSSVNY